MFRFIILLASLSVAFGLCAETYAYRFSNTPLSEALARISEDHPEANINFIYNEIEGYSTSARISTDNPLDAVREAVGFNPVTVARVGDAIFAEALQHGRYLYHGRVRNSAGEALEGATVMFLAGKDSVMVTYAVTGAGGGFQIPCDRRNVIVKVSCVGYRTRSFVPESFDMGDVTMIGMPIKLKEVTVKADDAYMLTDRTVYMPSSRQKNSAMDAVDLLRAMAIPQINVGPGGELSDVTGEAVKVFINSLPASEEEQKGLRTADVRRVEFIQYPTDARYGGAHKVINFIVHQYEYGGYTKGSVDESVLAGLQSYANLFNKFAYKKMTYDLYVGATNSGSRHTGRNISEEYLLTDNTGENRVLTRDESVDRARVKNNTYPVTLRATYATDKIQLINTIGFTHSGSPENSYSGSLRYSDDPERGYSYSRFNPRRSNSISYSGYLYKPLANGVTLNLTPSLQYTHRNDRSVYSTSKDPDMIDRTASENATSYLVDLTLSKDFDDRHSGMIHGGSYGNFSNLNYRGTERMNSKYSAISNQISINYTLSLGRLRLMFLESNWYSITRSNGVNENNFNVLGRVIADYRINDKNSMSAMANLSQRRYGIDSRTTEILRINEYMYATGNPAIKTSPQLDFSLDYTWLPSNKLYISGYVANYQQFRSRKILYTPYDDGRSLLRTTFNDGKFYRTNIVLNATLKLLDGKLQLNVNPRQTFYSTTGINARSYNAFSCSAGANLYLGRWYFNAYYYSPDNKMEEVDNCIVRPRNLYWVTAGWGNGTWNLRFSAYNIFNRGWDLYTETYRSEYYSYRSVGDNAYYHPRLNFAVTYTIGYGKKVNRGNEVGDQGSASSAILK